MQVEQFKSEQSNDELKELNSLHTYGQNLYKTNKTMKDLCNVLEHPEFRHFINKYFNNMDNTQAMLMLIDTYFKVENIKPDFTPYQKIAALHNLFNNHITRKNITDDFLHKKNNSMQNSTQNSLK
jgi:hypothetical protein